MQSHPLYLLISHLFATTIICVLFCRVGKQLGKTISRCSDHLNVQSNIQTTSTSNDPGHSLLAVSKQMFSNFCPCWDIECEQMGARKGGWEGKTRGGGKRRGYWVDRVYSLADGFPSNSISPVRYHRKPWRPDMSWMEVEKRKIILWRKMRSVHIFLGTYICFNNIGDPSWCVTWTLEVSFKWSKMQILFIPVPSLSHCLTHSCKHPVLLKLERHPPWTKPSLTVPFWIIFTFHWFCKSCNTCDQI